MDTINYNRPDLNIFIELALSCFIKRMNLVIDLNCTVRDLKEAVDEFVKECIGDLGAPSNDINQYHAIIKKGRKRNGWCVITAVCQDGEVIIEVIPYDIAYTNKSTGSMGFIALIVRDTPDQIGASDWVGNKLVEIFSKARIYDMTRGCANRVRQTMLKSGGR